MPKKQTKSKNYYAQLFVITRKFWSERSEAYKQVMKEAHMKDEQGFDKYQCATCKRYVAKSERHMDHKIPIGPTPQDKKQFVDAFERLDCDKEHLQVLCLHCHKIKTKQDLENMRFDEIKTMLCAELENMGYYHNVIKNDYTLSTLKKISALLQKIKKEHNDPKKCQKYEKKLHEFL